MRVEKRQEYIALCHQYLHECDSAGQMPEGICLDTRYEAVRRLVEQLKSEQALDEHSLHTLHWLRIQPRGSTK